MFGKKKRTIREQQQKIAELEQRIRELTEQNGALQTRVEDVERRESSIGRAISEATATADKMIEDAQRQAGAILEQAQSDSDAAKRDAEIMVDDAYRNARDIVKEAETEGERKLGEVQSRIDQYAALLGTYDRMVQEQIQMAQDGAKRFEELARELHKAVPQILSAEGQLIEPAKTPEPEEPAEAEEAKPQETVAEERLWTVDEIAKKPEEGEAQVDTIINEILTASEASE